MPTALIGIGSNVGDRRAYMDRARDQLRRLPQTQDVVVSPVYETDPVGPVTQDPFLNAAAALSTDLEPIDLLHHLQRIEKDAGRLRDQRWGPRTLDLDLLLYDNRVIDTQELTLPHPHMHQRWFVLKPLCDIAPHATHPLLKKTMQALLETMEKNKEI